jgi:hypothetical protein
MSAYRYARIATELGQPAKGTAAKAIKQAKKNVVISGRANRAVSKAK